MFEFKENWPRAPWKQTFRSLENANFRLYSGGNFVSMAGTWMQNVALSWVVYKMTGSPLALGLVQFASGLPLLLFLWVGGIVADRFDKRKVLIITQWLDMAQACALTLLVLTGHLTVPTLICLAVFLGCVTAIETPSRQAFVGELVPKTLLTSAIGINSAILNLSRLIGPVLAGFMLSTGGEALCFIFNAATYLAALWALYRIGQNAEKTTEEKAQADIDAAHEQEESPQSAAEIEIATSPGAWLKQRHISNVIFLVALTSLFGFQFSVLLPVIAAQNLHDSTGALVALLSASMGVGALFGSLAIATMGSVEWLERRIAYAALLLGGSIILLATSHSLLSSMMAMAGCGLSVSISLGGSNSLLQLQVPPKLRGRVMSVFSFFLMGLGPINALLAGFSAEHLGLMNALCISGFVMAAASFVYLKRAR